MNHTNKTQTFAILGAVMALALMPMLVDSIYADSTDDVTSKIQEIEKRLTTIQEKSENFKDSEIGKQAFQFRITGELLSDFKDSSIQEIIKSDPSLKAKLADLTTKYGSSLKQYNQKVTEYERDSSVSLDKKNLISQLKKNQMDYDAAEAKAEQKIQTEKLVKSELKRLDADKKFQKLHRDVYVQHDKDRGINTDDTLLIALTDVVEKEDFALVSAGMDKMINQYRDAEVRSQLQEYKSLVMDAMEELEEVNNQNTQVLALTSGDVEIPIDGEGFGKENEIFNPEIITNQLKEQIKTAVTSTKVLADKISEEHKSNYEAANKVANIIGENKPSTTTTEEPEEERKYETKRILNALSKISKANERVQSATDNANKAKANADDAKSALDAAQSALSGLDPETKEYKKALKQVNKAQKKLDKAESRVEKAENNVEKAIQRVSNAEQKLQEAQEKAHQQAVKKAQKAAEKAAKAANAAQKAADKAAAAKQRADDLAQKAVELEQAAEGADPDSKEAKKAQKAADKAQKASESAQKVQDKADTKEQKSNDAQQAAAEAASNVIE